MDIYNKVVVKEGLTKHMRKRSSAVASLKIQLSFCAKNFSRGAFVVFVACFWVHKIGIKEILASVSSASCVVMNNISLKLSRL